APSRHLYWSDSQGRNAGRSTNPAGKNGQGARPRRASYAARPRRRGDRVNRRKFIAMLGSAAAAWPLAARAQTKQMRRIGVLMAYAEDDPEAQAWISTLLQGLKERGWIDGSTARLDYRWASGNLEPMGSYAAELMALNPDLIVAAATPALEAVWRETRSVPIVFVNVADPIGQGFVAGMAQPGGNVTGFTSFEFSMGGKWVEVLKEISPSLVRI